MNLELEALRRFGGFLMSATPRSPVIYRTKHQPWMSSPTAAVEQYRLFVFIDVMPRATEARTRCCLITSHGAYLRYQSEMKTFFGEGDGLIGFEMKWSGVYCIQFFVEGLARDRLC